MNELAAHAGLSKRTVYRYFHSKDEIIEAALDSFMDDIADKIDEFISTRHKPEETVSRLLEIMCQVGQTINSPLLLDDLRRRYPHYWKKIDEYRMEKAEQIIQSILQTNEDDKAYIRDLDPRIVTTAVLASIQAVANPEFIVANSLTFEETIGQLIDFFQYGIMKQSED